MLLLSIDYVAIDLVQYFLFSLMEKFPPLGVLSVRFNNGWFLILLTEGRAEPAQFLPEQLPVEFSSFCPVKDSADFCQTV